MKVGSGDFIYELVENWGTLPEGARLNVVAGLGIDREDHIYLLSRGTPPVLVMDRDGNCIDTWGEGIFDRPHGLLVDKNHDLWGVDDHGHAVYKLSPSHELLMTLGTKGVPSDSGAVDGKYKTIKRPAGPFNRPTNIAAAKNGDLYVTDGYGNCRVHVFTPDGTLKFSWGTPGDGPGEFHLPHGIVIDDKETVYVADRENHRIQLFDINGNYLNEWGGFERPAGLFIADDGLLYVAECKRTSVYNGMPSRVTIVNLDGEVKARLGQEDEDYGKYNPEIGHHTAHSIVVDSEGSIYIGEVGQKIPETYFGLLKYRRCGTNEI